MNQYQVNDKREFFCKDVFAASSKQAIEIVAKEFGKTKEQLTAKKIKGSNKNRFR